jgi:hypothetical protein
MRIVPKWPRLLAEGGAALLLGMLTFVGCMAGPLQATATAASPTAAPPAATAPQTPTPATETTNFVWRRTAVAGTQMKLNFIAGLNPDCSTLPPNTVRISKQPTHGTVKIEAGEDFTSYPADNQRFECNRKRVPGVLVLYTPDASYTGPDAFIIHTITPTGFVQNTTYLITVE